MMRARMTYVPVDVAEQFGDFIITRDEQVLDAVRARTREFNTLTLLKLLYQLRNQSMTFTELFARSKIRLKRSYLNYLNLCLEYNFIQKNPSGPNMLYSITAKGHAMLNLFIQKKSWAQ